MDEELRRAELSELRRAIRKASWNAPENRVLHRLHLVLLLRAGVALSRVADWFGTSERSLRRWNRMFEEDGLSALLEGNRGGRPKKLGDDQLEQVIADVSQRPAAFGFSDHEWTGKLLRDHIERQFAIELSVRQCQRLLHDIEDTCEASDMLFF